MVVTTKFQASSKRLVNRYGKVRVYKHILSQDEYNVDTQETETTYSVYSNIKSFKAQATEKELRSPNLVSKDLEVYLLANSDLESATPPFIPVVGDVIIDVINTVETELRVEVIHEHHAGDKVSMWRLICVRV